MSDQLRRICLVGLGHMGHPIGAQWLAAGREVVGFDLSTEARAQFEQAGGAVAWSLEEAAADVDAVVLLLPNSEVVDRLVSSLLEGDVLRKGTLIIDMSSAEPEHTKANAVAAVSRGFSFVDAPISGGVVGAENGTLTVMLGAGGEAVPVVEALLTELGTLIHVGEVGSGHAAKALNNLLSATHLWATSEAVTIGERFGIEPEALLNVINGSSGRSGSSQVKWPKFILTGEYNSGFSAALMLKDAKIAAGLMQAFDARSEVAEQIVRMWQSAVDDLPAGADHTEIAKWIRDRASIESVASS